MHFVQVKLLNNCNMRKMSKFLIQIILLIFEQLQQTKIIRSIKIDICFYQCWAKCNHINNYRLSLYFEIVNQDYR